MEYNVCERNSEMKRHLRYYHEMKRKEVVAEKVEMVEENVQIAEEAKPGKM